MSDLFKKLNLLIKSNLGDLMGESRAPLPPERLGKDIDREVAALRQRVNEAVAYENQLRARVQSLQDEAARWDQQADAAVSAGSDAAARHAIENLKRAQRHVGMAENDLREHQLVTQELIQRVNMLEAAVVDARRREAARTENQPEARSPATMLSDVLRDAREKIAGLDAVIEAKNELQQAPETTTPSDIDDDLTRRRQRLSK